MKGRFKIIVPSFNSFSYLPKTLSSIADQANKNYDVCVIDDASSFKEQREIILDYAKRYNWKYLFHKTNLGALASILDGIKAINCQDDDVIVLLDGDDWFYDEHVLERLDEIYTKEDIYLTWGQFETYPLGCIHINYADEVEDEVIEKKLFRKIDDVFWPLRSFKYRLFREIRKENLIDPQTGEYFRVSGDKALMYPMLEMAGHKIKFVEDTLYVYNMENPLNDYKINRSKQIEATNAIRAMPPCDSIKF